MKEDLTKADYDHAIELWPTALVGMVRNAAVQARWIGDEDRFWYRDDTPTGPRFMQVDAESGNQSPLFDHASVAKSLAVGDGPLPFTELELVEGGRKIDVALSSGRKRIDLASGAVSEVDARVPTELAGPAGRVLFIREHNLWLREPGGSERQVTDNGEAFHSWCTAADLDLRGVARSRGQEIKPLVGAFWSPDGTRILAMRVDERDVEPYPYLESVPADGSARPKLHWVRQRLAGEARSAQPEWNIIDLQSGTQIPVCMPAPWRHLAIEAAESGCAWWSADGTLIHAVAQSSDTLAAVSIDAANGQVRVLHVDETGTFADLNSFAYHCPIARLLPSRNEMLWYSQQSGWGHLYTVDLVRGGIKRQVTDGPWAVFDVVAVRGQTVYFTAGGREPGRQPYHRHLYRVSLDGAAPNNALELLTPEDADHALSGGPLPGIMLALGAKTYPCPVSASGRFFVDSVSTVLEPTRTLLRRTDGSLVCEVVRADVSALLASGWQPPEPFTAKAADGSTDLYGVIVKPRRFDPAKKYPVIERIYGGPQVIAQPRTFLEGLNGAFMYGANSMADLGFVAVVMDGPGTPYRSRAFHEMTWNLADRWGISHHRAAIEGAAASRPWMDLTRVGVTGHSYGGYATAMAMLLEPGFYKVGVSSAGMYDPSVANQGGAEHYLGAPDFGGGRVVKNATNEVAPTYVKYAPETYARQLAGRLLLVYGDLDENIQPAGLLRLAAALIKADKHHDQLCLPGRSHSFVSEPYFQKRTWDYFIEHLAERRPLIHHALGVQAGVRMTI